MRASRNPWFVWVLTAFVALFMAGCGGGGSGNSPSATLASITVTPANPSIATGTTQQFKAIATYSDNSIQDLTASVSWASSIASVAIVDSNGLASAGNAGVTTISAAINGVFGHTILTVTAATLVSVAVTPITTSIAAGSTQPFKAAGTFSDNSMQDLTSSVTWSSSAPGVATISNTAGSNGLAAGLAAGSSTISADIAGLSATANLTVTSALLDSIAVTPANPSIAIGTHRMFKATGTYSDNSTQDLTSDVTWTSSVPGVATISNTAGSNGLAAAAAAGTSTITASFGSVSGMTILTVTPAILVSIAVTPSSPSVMVGASQQFTATGTYSDNSTSIITTSVTWNSSAASVATVSNAAGSNGLATAVGAGSTMINATSGSVTGHATLTVPVTYSLSGAVTINGGLTPLQGVTMNLAGGTPIVTDMNGLYSFSGLSDNTSYTVTPSLGGYTFQPAAIAATVSGANLTGENFVAVPGGCANLSDAQTTQIGPSGAQAYFSASSPDGVYFLGGATLTETTGTTVAAQSSISPTVFLIASVGPVCGLGGITAVPTTGYAASLALQQGNGYVGQMGDGSYIRFYVSSIANAPEIDIQYEYPSTVCPSSATLLYVPGDKAEFNGVPSGPNGPSSPQTGAQNGFPFFGCAGAVQAQVWGGGGGGGAGTVVFAGGNGGGGGGGGGYSSQSFTMVPGQWYVLSAGASGEGNADPSGNGNGIAGGASSFAVEAGSTLLSASGGQPGTAAGSGATAGAGGSGGGGSGTTSAAGGSGGNGVSNFNKALCGGAGSIGPGGAGGDGGGSNGGAGGSGGCSPGLPSAPGGGGPGASENGGAVNGANGQVKITW